MNTICAFPCYVLQVERGFIYYVHDSSETQNDSFSLLANDTERERLSLPITIHVIVEPINDEAPVVYVNNGLKGCHFASCGITVSVMCR